MLHALRSQGPHNCCPSRDSALRCGLGRGTEQLNTEFPVLYQAEITLHLQTRCLLSWGAACESAGQKTQAHPGQNPCGIGDCSAEPEDEEGAGMAYVQPSPLARENKNLIFLGEALPSSGGIGSQTCSCAACLCPASRAAPSQWRRCRSLPAVGSWPPAQPFPLRDLSHVPSGRLHGVGWH